MILKPIFVIIFALFSKMTLGHGLDRTSDQYSKYVDCRLPYSWKEVSCDGFVFDHECELITRICTLEYEGRGYSTSDLGVITVMGNKARIEMDRLSYIFPQKKRCYLFSSK